MTTAIKSGATPPPRKGKGKKRDRRREILDGAVKLFQKRGYRGTSMDDIASEVGLTKGTLYHHFPSKGEILAEIYNESIDFLLERVARHPADEEAKALVPILVRDILELITEQQAHIIVLFQEMRWIRQWLPPHQARRIEEKRNRFENYVIDAIRRGSESGDFKVEDPQIAAYALIGMCNWSYQWFNPKGRLSIDQITSMLTSMALGGLGADPYEPSIPANEATPRHRS